MKSKILLLLFIGLLFVSAVNADSIVRISPQNPTTNDDLYCTVRGAQYQDDFFFEWRINGRVVDESNYRTTSRFGSILGNLFTNEGDTITCAVTDFFGIFIGTTTVEVQQLIPQNQIPTAVIISSLTTTNVNTQILFDSTDSTDSDGTIVNEIWDFGDGESATGKIVNHAFENPGTYTVTLMVIDDDGARDTDSALITILPIPGTQVIDITNMNIYSNEDFSRLENNFFRTDYVYLTFRLRDHETNEDVDIDTDTITPRILTEGRNIINFRPYNGNIGIFGLIKIYNSRECFGIPPFCIITGDRYYYSTYISRNDNNLGNAEVKIELENSESQSRNIVINNNQPISGGRITGNFNVDELITFTSDGSYDVEDGTDLIYSWNFGDGNSAEGQEVTHTYDESRDYFVQLTVTDSEGDSSLNLFMIHINPRLPEPGVPEVRITNPADDSSFAEDINILFTSEVSDLEDNLEEMNCVWNFGDGNTEEDSCDELNSITHPYNTPGDYVVSLTAVDSDNASATVSITLHITEVVPPEGRELIAVMKVSNQNPEVNEVIQFSARRSTGNIRSYSWNFGDGNSANGIETSHYYSSEGTFTARLTVTDINGNSKTVSKTIVVTGFGLDDKDSDKATTKFITESDYHNFQIGRVTSSSNVIKPGENINLYIKVSNLGDNTERLNLKVYVPGVGIIAIATTRLDAGEINIVPLYVRLPPNTTNGNYIATITMDNNRGDSNKGYWTFSVQN